MAQIAIAGMGEVERLYPATADRRGDGPRAPSAVNANDAEATIPERCRVVSA